MSNIFTPKRTTVPQVREKHLQSLIYLCDALSSIQNPIEAAAVLRDLFTPQEMIMIANRLQISALLLEGNDYSHIRESLMVSTTTIAKVSTWLETRGDGYRLLTDRTRMRPIGAKPNINAPLQSTKYSQYLWPELLISGLLKMMNKDNAYKILDILAEANQKPELFKVLDDTTRKADKNIESDQFDFSGLNH